MATKYSTQVTNNEGPRNIQAGLQTVVGVYNSNGTSLSASDVIQMVRVPHGAIIIDRIISGVIPGDAFLVKIGDGGDDDRYGTVTLSATAQCLSGNAAAGHAYQVSLSDDATVRYETIDLTISTAASQTTTSSIVLTVNYFMAPKSA